MRKNKKSQKSLFSINLSLETPYLKAKKSLNPK